MTLTILVASVLLNLGHKCLEVFGLLAPDGGVNAVLKTIDSEQRGHVCYLMNCH